MILESNSNADCGQKDLSGFGDRSDGCWKTRGSLPRCSSGGKSRQLKITHGPSSSSVGLGCLVFLDFLRRSRSPRTQLRSQTSWGAKQMSGWDDGIGKQATRPLFPACAPWRATLKTCARWNADSFEFAVAGDVLQEFGGFFLEGSNARLSALGKCWIRWRRQLWADYEIRTIGWRCKPRAR